MAPNELLFSSLRQKSPDHYSSDHSPTELIGQAHPEEVRKLPVPRIPLPSHPRVKQLTKEAGLLNADTGGLTAGYGVIVRLDCTRNLRLLAHEFVFTWPSMSDWEQRDFFKNT